MTRPPRPRGEGPGSVTKRARRLRLAPALILAVLAATAAGFFLGPGPAARLGASTDVVVASGGGLRGVASTLQRAGVVRSNLAFMALAAASGAAHGLKAGEYEIPSRASLWRVIQMLRHGDVVRRLITIPEGWTSAAAADAIRRSPFLTGPVVTPPEGSLLPETYEVKRGETRMALIARMRAARDSLLAELWARRAPGLPYATPEQAVILASVVERETGLAAERPRIAAVFINRLRKGMRLESDPTVIYGVSGGAPLGHDLRVSELARVTPYNTYRVDGLPPTPIANPGKAALAAALGPAPTRDLYFVADGTGGHVFAATFDDHRRNVARWRALQRARDGEGGS